MNGGILLVTAFLLNTITLIAQGPPDAVERFLPGSGQTSGQESKYYPANILGLPDSSARDSVPTVDPVHVLSLGLGGEIVLRFDRHPIIDRPGMDFTIFENAFRYRIGGRDRIYAEPARVAVSSDGITYFDYPDDSLTLAGCAGVTPINGDRNPFDAAVSGGNSFDLADVGIDTVRYLRIHDVTSIVRDDRTHPFWDPTLTGFDLDAVLSLHGATAVVPGGGSGRSDRTLSGPNPAGDFTRVSLSLLRPASVRGWLVDMRGERTLVITERMVGAGKGDIVIETRAFSSGEYLLVMEIDGESLAPIALRVVR